MPEEKPSPSSVPHKPAENGDGGNLTEGAPGSTGGSAQNAPAAGQKPTGNLQAAPLSDGTIPTVLAPGTSHRSVAKSKASLSRIYKRADVATTLLTFVGAVIAALVILGGYAYFTRSRTPVATAPKVTSLDKSDLDKLGAFFTGNTTGTSSSSEVLTISPSSLFKGRVAMGSDLKVVGGAQVSGTASLADLTVDKTSTLGVTNVRGALTVSGPFVLQSPATLGAGGTVTGNLSVSGNGSYGGSISAGVVNARDITVSGNLNVNGHFNVGGQNPTAAPVTAASASVSGNDSAGTVTVGPVSSSLSTAELAWVTFRSGYPTVPTIIITPIGRCSALIEPYIQATATRFMIGAAKLDPSCSSQSYAFSYWVVQ